MYVRECAWVHVGAICSLGLVWPDLFWFALTGAPFVRLLAVLIGTFVPTETYTIRQKRRLWNFEQQQLAAEARVAQHRA